MIAEEAEVLGKPPADLIVAVERREIGLVERLELQDLLWTQTLHEDGYVNACRLP